MKKSIIKGITSVATSIILLAATMPLDGIASHPSSVTAATVSATTKNKTSSKTLNVTRKTQDNEFWCNVACAQMMLDYYKVTATQDEIYKKGKKIDKITEEDYEDGFLYSGETRDAIKSLLKGSSFISTATGCTFSDIKKKIDGGKPVIINARYTNEKTKKYKDHAVICYGYESDTKSKTYKLYVRDPGDDNITYLKASDTNKNSFTVTLKNKYSVSIRAIIYAKAAYKHK